MEKKRRNQVRTDNLVIVACFMLVFRVWSSILISGADEKRQKVDDEEVDGNDAEKTEKDAMDSEVSDNYCVVRHQT